MSFRRMLPFILINIVVSAIVVLGILFWWEGRDTEETAVAAIAPPTPTMPLATIVIGNTEAEEAIPTEEPEDELPIHTVAAGDTLGKIGTIYGVPYQDIMAFNGLTSDYISIGQELIIPIDGLPTATPIATAEPTATPGAPPEPIATVEMIEEGEAVVELTAVSGDIDTEHIEIKNTGSRQIALQGWKIVDIEGNAYTFGQVTLFGEGAAIKLHTAVGTDGPSDLYGGLSEPIWEPGELVTLLNAEGSIVATTIVP